MFTKINRIGWEILEIFFNDPSDSFHLRKVAKKIGVSPRTAKKHLSALEEEEFVNSEEEGVYLNYKASKNQKFKDWKMLYNIRKVRDSGLVEYLNKKFKFPLIVLFGSLSEGNDSKKSDIDIFVLASSKKGLDLKKFKKNLGKEVQLHLRTKKELLKMKKKNPELLNNIVNGIVLSGYWEIF